MLLGAAQTDEDADEAGRVVEGVGWVGSMMVLRLPGSLLTQEGREGVRDVEVVFGEGGG